MAKSKKQFYKALIHHNLKETYHRMEDLIATLPMTGVDIDIDTPDSRTIRNVLAIEEEWIVDPQLRKEMSLIDLQPPPKPWDDPLA